jgi:hypothetical protein
MAGIAQKVTWGIAAMAATKVARAGTRRMLHNERGAVRLPETVKRRSGFGTAILWAASAGVLIGVSDILREQRKDVADQA